MDIIWSMGTCSIGDVMSARNGKKKLAYTTIATIIDRLYAKRFLRRMQKGKRYIYEPAVTRAEFGKNVATHFIQRFLKNFGDVAIASFAESIEELPEKKRRSLLKTIKEYEEK